MYILKFITGSGRILYVPLMHVHNYSDHISVYKIGHVSIKKVSKLHSSVKGPSLCNLANKVMNI